MGRVIHFILRLLAFLPLRVHYVLCDGVAWLCEHVFHYRKHDITINLARSFPDLKYDEVKHLRHLFYKHLAEQLAETIWFGGCRNPERLRRQHIVEIENPDEINRLYELAPSVMVLMSHSGNWELIGGIENYDYTGNPTHISEDNFCVVYRLQSIKMWNDILKDGRTAPLKDRENYKGYLESGMVLRYMLAHKNEKKVYNFITDQYPYAEASGYMRLKLLNQKCISMKGAAEIAHKLGMAVCYMSMPQVRRGLYKIQYKTICEDASTMRAVDIMKQYYKLLEADIAVQPWNWLWSHRRWKDETGVEWTETE